MKNIPVSNGKFVIVDDEDYDFLMQWRWNLCRMGYARRRTKEGTVLMHRVINKTPKGTLTDHIDGNKLNNMKSNLRNCNRSQNRSNAFKTKGEGESKYKGVGRSKNGWKAYIKINKKQKHLGNFKTEEDAATAYNLAAFLNFGEFARINT